jgi:hypothetical protein
VRQIPGSPSTRDPARLVRFLRREPGIAAMLDVDTSTSSAPLLPQGLWNDAGRSCSRTTRPDLSKI